MSSIHYINDVRGTDARNTSILRNNRKNPGNSMPGVTVTPK